MDSEPNPYEVPNSFPEELPTSSKPSKSIRFRPLIFVIFVAWGGYLGSIWSVVFGDPWQTIVKSNIPEAIGVTAGGLFYFLTFRGAKHAIAAEDDIETKL